MTIISRALPHTVTIQVATTAANRYGDAERSFAAPVTRTANAFVQPVYGTEQNTVEGDTLTGQYFMITDDAELSGYDQVIWEGNTYQVVGPPNRWDIPTTGFHHLEAQLRLVTG